MVAPAFDYGAPVCLIIAQQYAQQTSKQNLQFLGGVGGKHPLATAAGDVCWMSTKQRHQFQTLTLVLHIAKGSSKKVFVACKNLIEEVHVRNWSSEVKLFCLNVISPGGTATLLEIV